MARNPKHRIEYFAREVSHLTARGQNHIPLTWAPLKESSEKSRPQILMKLEQALADRMIKYDVKEFWSGSEPFDL